MQGGELERHPSLSDRRDPAINVVPYDPEWVGEFEREAAAVRDAAERCPSPNRTRWLDRRARPAREADHRYSGFSGQYSREGLFRSSTRTPRISVRTRSGFPRLPLLRKASGAPGRYHVHVCAAGSDEEMRHLVVRDFLRSHSEEAAGYADMKRELARLNHQDRLAYIEGKEPFMRDLERRAVAWSKGRGSG
jgi:GrpB-like predicted nucleotidyltransferase (UPF0157 family)